MSERPVSIAEIHQRLEDQIAAWRELPDAAHVHVRLGDLRQLRATRRSVGWWIITIGLAGLAWCGVAETASFFWAALRGWK